jgi:hypothetical protein
MQGKKGEAGGNELSLREIAFGGFGWQLSLIRPATDNFDDIQTD